MLINSLKLRHYSSLKIIKRLFSSQIIKTNDTSVVSKEKQQNIEKVDENEEKALSEERQKELEILQKPEYMDRIWELNLNYSHKAEYNRFTDPYREAKQDFKDTLNNMYSGGHDFGTLLDFKKGMKRRIIYSEENLNKYVARRHAKLGPDLAVANFIIVRGGRVLFTVRPDVWATSLDHFPPKYDPRYRILAIDASDTKIRFESIDNFVELNSLEAMNLSKNRLDDWSCDKIGRMFRSTNLSVLDLSDNQLITYRGIETLHRVRSLKSLNIKGTLAAKYPFIELLVVLFNELVPECHIIYE